LAKSNPSAFRSGAWLHDLAIAVGDLSGDGDDDLLLYGPSTGEWSVMTNSPAGLLASLSGVWRSGLTVATGDLDGDGRADVLLYDRNDRTWTRCSSRIPETLACDATGAWDPAWAVVGRRR
jgi:hypothetical protein